MPDLCWLLLCVQ